MAHWNGIDYSFGSDPNFERHKDSRKKKNYGSATYLLLEKTRGAHLEW